MRNDHNQSDDGDNLHPMSDVSTYAMTRAIGKNVFFMCKVSHLTNALVVSVTEGKTTIVLGAQPEGVMIGPATLAACFIPPKKRNRPVE